MRRYLYIWGLGASLFLGGMGCGKSAQSDQGVILDLTNFTWVYQAGHITDESIPVYPSPDWQIVGPSTSQTGSERGNVGWYRVAFTLPDSVCYQEACALQLGAIQGADETYLNGVLIGQSGYTGRRAMDVVVQGYLMRVYPLAATLLRADEPNVLTIRMQNWDRFSLFIWGTPHLVSTALGHTRQTQALQGQIALEIISLMAAIGVGMISFFLFVTRAFRQAYLFLGSFGLAMTLVQLAGSSMAVQAGLVSPGINLAGSWLALILPLLFYHALSEVFGPMNRWVFPLLWISMTGIAALWGFSENGSGSYPWYVAGVFLFCIIIVWLAVLTYRAIRQGNARLWPILICFVVVLIAFLSAAQVVQIGPYLVDPLQIAMTVFMLGLGTAALWYYIGMEREAEHLEVQTQNLRALDGLKSRFFANISHEFRTPLTLIQGPLHDLRQGTHGALSDQGEAVVAGALRNTERLRRLIEELLTLSRLEAGKLELHARLLDVSAFVKRVVSNFSSLAEHQQIQLDVTAEKSDLRLYADPNHLETILVNLVGNAFKFTEPGDQVTVTLAPEDAAQSERGLGDFLAIHIQDTGQGIPETALPHLFDRFYQVETSGASEQGTGIGLALVHELVVLHGGTITVASQVGEGTTFTLRLPQGTAHLMEGEILPESLPAEIPEATGEAQTLPPESLAGEAHTVLIVEDHPELRTYIQTHLSESYQLILAEDGEEGLHLARTHQPDLIISDVMMPRMDGMTLLKTLKTDPALRAIPVIMLTARADESDRLAGLRARADVYMAKPFRAEELRVQVANVLANRRVLREAYGQQVVAVEAEHLALTDVDQAFLIEVQQFVEARLADEDFTVNALAEGVFMSKRTLERRLKALTDLTPAGYIRQIRLQRAQQLLTQRAVHTIAEAAHAVGFADVHYFSRLYHKQFGARPTLPDR